jgi:hypothetical protein
MRFACRFAPEAEARRGEEIVISVELSPAECKAVKQMVRDGDPHASLKAAGMALKAAYKLRPPGYLHIANGTEQVLEH